MYNTNIEYIMHEQNSEPPLPYSPKRQEQSITFMLPPANPIIPKSLTSLDEKVSFKLDQSKPLPLSQSATLVKQEKGPLPEEQPKPKKQGFLSRKVMQKMTLTNGYEPSSLIFMKHSNQQMNRRGKLSYFASMFIPFDTKKTVKVPQYLGMVAEDDSLVFESSYQSANLMAVYRVDSNSYDLILQNDLNTKCFTQWYNFKIRNKRSNFIAKFNIVNLYKTKSLYSMGMKPIVQSEKSDKGSKRVWRRKGFNIFYDKNELHYEDNENKYYKTLSFSYDFTVENDCVQFAHCLPYDLTDLKKLVEQIKDHPKVSVSSIGTTIMGRPIPLIKIATDNLDNKITKKALVIMARQHPGQTPGSYIMEEMILELLKNKTEVQFLTWRYDIYIFPMVNIDGVVLGNYRGNFAGYDLNRCWLRPEPSKQPEVVLIKNCIRKIAKKQAVELVLDLHGHSRKMGSFFYGNDYGSNHMLFPYIASKLNRNILFPHSKFTHQTQSDAKFSTARVVLGNLIKDTGGYVYTYEVSFFGYYKEGTNIPFAFTEDHYKHLGKSLVLAIYRTYLEIYKEQKGLKESTYLKNIKGELTHFNPNQDGKEDDNSESGSDSEAEEEMIQQTQAIEEFIQQHKYEEEKLQIPIRRSSTNAKSSLKKELTVRQKVIVNLNQQAQTGDVAIIINRPQHPHREFKQFGLPVQRYNEEIKKKIEQLLDKNMQNDLKSVINERLPRISNREHLKSEKLAEDSPSPIYNSSQVQRSPQQAYLDYLKLKKQKSEFQQNLNIHGNTFELLGKRKVLSSTKNKEEEEKGSKQLDSLNFIGPTSSKVETRERSSKSYHTVDMNGYVVMSRQQKDLIERKPHFHRKKMTSNQITKQESAEEPLREPMGPSQYIPRSAFQVQRLQTRSPSKSGWTSLSPTLKSQSRVKLPSIGPA